MQITQNQINVCSSPLRNKHIKIEVLDFDFQILDTIETEVLSGTVTVDANNDNRRGCSIEMVVPPEFNMDDFIRTDATGFIRYGGRIWIDRYLKIYEGIENIQNGGEIEWFKRGVFIIDSPTQNFSGDTHTISFNGIDLMVRLSGERGGQLANLAIVIPEFADQHNKIRTTLREALVSVLVDFAQIENYIIDENIEDERWKYLPYDIKVGAGNTVYDLLSALRDLVPEWEMFFDEDGTFVFQAIPSGEGDFTIDISDAQIVADTLAVDFNNVKNQIIVYGGLNDALRYTDVVTYTPISNRINLYYDAFSWSELMINSRISFLNLNEYNEFTINKLSIYVGESVFAENIPLVAFENTAPSLEELELEPSEIYILRVLSGDTDTEGKLTGTNVVFDLFSRQQPRNTAVDDNKLSPYYINNSLPSPNYYGGESKSTGFAYSITINDQENPISELDNNTRLTFMPNILTGSYKWKANSSPISSTVLTSASTSLAYGAGVYIATLATGVFRSADGGATWTNIAALSSLTNAIVIYWTMPGNPCFFIAGTNAVYTSFDGISWTARSTGYPTSLTPSCINLSDDMRSVNVGFTTGASIFQMSELAFNYRTISLSSTGGTYPLFFDKDTGYALNGSGVLHTIASATATVAYTLPLTNCIGFHKKYKNSEVGWIQQYSGNAYNRIAYGDGQFIAAEQPNKVLTSSDGKSWVERLTGFSSDPSVRVTSIAHGNNLWVIGGSESTLSTSENGREWVSRVVNFKLHNSSFAANIYGVAHGNGLWVAVGADNNIAISTDAISWTNKWTTSAFNDLRAVAYGNGLWVAVGNSGRLATSPDGNTWTLQTSGFGSSTIYGVHFADGLWVIVGEDGKLATSTNGTSWSLQTSGFGSSAIFTVSYADGLWTAGGASGRIGTSINGTSWTTQAEISPSHSISGVAYNNGLWVVATDRIFIKINNRYTAFSDRTLLTTESVKTQNTWQRINNLNSPTYRKAFVYNYKLYLWGADTPSGNFVLVSNNDSWSTFDNISDVFYNNDSSNFYCNTIASNATKLVAIFKTTSGEQGYFAEQISNTSDIVYRLLVYSSNNPSTPIAIGDIVTKTFNTLPYGKFTNDYTIQLVRYDKVNNRFIYEGFLNSYLQVNIGGEFDVIPSDELCGQRARYELYLHSNTNNSITLSAPSIYYLDVNKRIHYFNSYKDEPAGHNYYLTKELTFPLKAGESMTINAIQLYDNNL